MRACDFILPAKEITSQAETEDDKHYAKPRRTLMPNQFMAEMKQSSFGECSGLHLYACDPSRTEIEFNKFRFSNCNLFNRFVRLVRLKILKKFNKVK